MKKRWLQVLVGIMCTILMTGVVSFIVSCTSPSAPTVPATSTSVTPIPTTAEEYPGLADMKPITISYATYLTQGMSSGYQGLASWVQAIEGASKGKIKMDMHYGASLLAVGEMPEGIGKGIADSGDLVATYAPAAMPVFSFVSELGWMAPDWRVAVGVVDEMPLVSQELQEELAKLNVVFVPTAYSSSPYVVTSTKPISKLENWKGLRVRVPGVPYQHFVEGMGGVAVSIPNTAEAVDAMSKGMIDATMHTASTTLGVGYMSYAKYGLLTPILSWQTWIGFNADKWHSLPDVAKRLIVDQGPLWDIKSQQVELTDLEKYIQYTGFQVSATGDDALESRVKELRTSLIQQSVQDAKAKGIVKDPQKIVDLYSASVQKWQGIVNQIGTGQWGDGEYQAYTQRLRQEHSALTLKVFP